MKKSLSLTDFISLVAIARPSSRTRFLSFPIPRSLSTLTRYPLQYDLIHYNPTQSSLDATNRPRLRLAPVESPESPPPDFETWIDRKLGPGDGLTKAQRKYYVKRRMRLLGGESELKAEKRRRDHGLVELEPEIDDFQSLHEREEELFFYDAFAFPWDKDKHYRMVYRLEKKFFPRDCLDNAFLEPGTVPRMRMRTRTRMSKDDREMVTDNQEEDMGRVFFEEKKKKSEEESEKAIDVLTKRAVGDVSDKREVLQFFKDLRNGPNRDARPYILTRTNELPPSWDSESGTVVLINKPKGWTSFTVCGKLRRLVKVKKVGHAGTLDPMATGLLIVCVGKATKLVESYQGMVKGYSGTFRLGEATSTLDADSPVIQREPWEHIKDSEIKRAVKSFCGEIQQVPPMFSAIKVDGERMYDKARRGETIELSARNVSIFKFEIERSLDDRQNLIFRVVCSKGTYIRSLCADLGKKLGSCAHLIALRRDSIGDYSAKDAWEFNELEEAINKNYF